MLYGWTSNKDVLKAFLSQRDEKKYGYVKIHEEDIGRFFDETVDDTDIMIDCLKLKSVGSKEEITFFTTANELHQAEKDIQRFFKRLASFESIKGEGEYVQMVIHLDDYFSSALFYLGYRPQDIDIMFPSADESDDFSGLSAAEREIDDAYEMFASFPQEKYEHLSHPLGMDMLSDISSKIIYSLESFIKVLKDEL